jgi:glycine/D-amino acid oxidase-like deaminating enzyme
MPNLYRDTAGPAESPSPLDAEQRADVVVVGAGFTGLSTALHLAEKGARVAVLDAHEAGYGASGRNGGQVNPGLKYDPDIVERDFGPDLGRRMNALAGAAPQFVFDLIERLGLRCEARRHGTLRAASHENHAARVRETVEQWRRRNAPVELLEGDALLRATGTAQYRAAMWDRRGGDLNPLLYARGLGAAAVRAGARLYCGTRASRMARTGDAWRVETATGAVTAAHVVLATNGYTDDLWPGLRRTIVPVFGAIAASAPLPQDVAARVMPSRAVLYESGAITVYYRVDLAQRLLIGGRGPMREIDSTKTIGHLLAYADKLWPSLRGLAWPYAWGGRLAMTRDAYPHIHEPAPGVLMCLGYNGRGVAMATAMGAQLANRISNPSGSFDMPISTMKPIALHALWPLAVRAAIVRGRINDAFGL